jgi:hypothetical protein
MRRSIIATALLASVTALPVLANDGVELSAKARSLAVASAVSPSKQSEAPFAAGRDPLPELLLREEQERRTARGTCDASATTLCYDMADGRIVYRPARAYMPQFDGMRAESISLRHNKVVLKYSFR